MAMIDTERYAQELSKLRETVEKAADALHLPQLEEELTELKEEMNEPEFWNNLERSTAVNRKVGQIEGKINHVARLRSRADDIEAMLMLLNEEPDEEMADECGAELTQLTADADALELETAQTQHEVHRAVMKLANEGVPVIFITERAAQLSPETMERFKSSANPVLIPIPGSQGTNGFGMQRVKANVEKAIGADILFESPSGDGRKEG